MFQKQRIETNCFNCFARDDGRVSRTKVLAQKGEVLLIHLVERSVTNMNFQANELSNCQFVELSCVELSFRCALLKYIYKESIKNKYFD